MPDRVKITIGGKEVATYTAFSADSNLLIPADEFSVTLPGAHPEIKAGERFYLHVNDTLEMNGIIEKREPRIGPNGGETALSGRDLMGIVVDSCLGKEDCNSLHAVSLKNTATRFFGKLPYINASKIVSRDELADKGVSGRKNIYKKPGGGNPFAELLNTIADEQYERGATVFEALADKAQRHGQLFWLEPDGTFVFGRPQGQDAPVSFSFHLWKEAERWGDGGPHLNNVLSATLAEDISKVYSDVTVVAQSPGGGENPLVVGEHDQEGSAKFAGFPYKKPLVIQRHCKTAAEAKAIAHIEMYKRIADSWRLKLSVPGFSLGNVNYRANAACNAAIEPLGVDGKYLILGRRFTFSVSEGQKTELEIGKLMEGYVDK
jgi:prophage tail gpP-like protein